MTVSTNHSRPLELGFLSPHNPYDRQSFSGSAFFAARALDQRRDVNLHILGPHTPPRFFNRFLKRHEDEFTLSKDSLDRLDAVVGLVATSLLETLSNLRPDLPFCHVTDATPDFLRNTYGWSIPSNADTSERLVAARAARTVYSSRMMADRAPGDLGLPEIQARAIPFGINLEDLPDTLPEKPGLDRLELLFVGVDWVRKGGDIAVATLEAVRAAGREAHLTVVGTCPARHRRHPHITYAGFLNKNRPVDARRLAALYAGAHLLLLPSRGDCTPMVVAEAMTHGTPVVATDTGGIADLLKGGGAGSLLPEFSSAQKWAEAILGMTSDPTHYAFLSEAGFDQAQSQLSWTSWAREINGLLRGVLTETTAAGRILRFRASSAA